MNTTILLIHYYVLFCKPYFTMPFVEPTLINSNLKFSILLSSHKTPLKYSLSLCGVLLYNSFGFPGVWWKYTMPPKRHAAASQAVALNLNSNYDDVLSFVGAYLSTDQFIEVSNSKRKWLRGGTPFLGSFEIMGVRNSSLLFEFQIET